MHIVLKNKFSLKQVMDFEKLPDVNEQKCRSTCIILVGFIVYALASLFPAILIGYRHGTVTNVAIAMYFIATIVKIQLTRQHIIVTIVSSYVIDLILFFHFIMETDWTLGMDAFWLFILITPFITDYLVGPVYGTIAAFSGFLLSYSLFCTPIKRYLQPYGKNMLQWYSVIYVVVMITAFALSYELTTYQIVKRQSDEKIAYFEKERANRLRETLTIYENNEHTIRKYKHDIKHYNRVLAGFIAEKDYEKAANYLKEFDSLLDTVTAVSFCDNQIVNELLTIYASRCQKLGFKLRVKAVVPDRLPMEELDLTSLVANALENAIEAQERVVENQRAVQVDINYDGRKLRLFTKNTCAIVTSFKENGLPVSSRSIQSGIGTSQIKSIAEKYSGVASFSQEGNVFTVKAIMTCM